jgi:hypothetical protein
MGGAVIGVGIVVITVTVHLCAGAALAVKAAQLCVAEREREKRQPAVLPAGPAPYATKRLRRPHHGAAVHPRSSKSRPRAP